ncbi:DUF4190 domain-containing protein [Salininema proteolyticum]|uniref:DUF4190 domain-containing protein n=1 Tax=Salininema proteolyticum TaxID=1607685 RepID=A0ABV8TW53_9ACTN
MSNPSGPNDDPGSQNPRDDGSLPPVDPGAYQYNPTSPYPQPGNPDSVPPSGPPAMGPPSGPPGMGPPAGPPMMGPPPMAPYGYPAPPYPQNGLGWAGLTCGIVGLCLVWWAPFLAFVSWVLAILAIVFGSIGLSKAGNGLATNKGAAITGLVTGILTFLAPCFIVWIVADAAIGGIFGR